MYYHHMTHCCALLIFLMSTFSSGMETEYLFPTHIAYNKNNTNVAIILSDLSMRLWNIQEDSLRNISLDSIRQDIANQKIHSIKHHNEKAIKITTYKPSIQTSAALQVAPIKVNGKTLFFDIETQEWTVPKNDTEITINEIKYNDMSIRNSSSCIAANFTGESLGRQFVYPKIQAHALYLDTKDNSLVAIGLQNRTTIHCIKNEKEVLYTIDHPEAECSALTFIDGKCLIIGTKDGVIAFYNFHTNNPEKTKFIDVNHAKKLELIKKEKIEQQEIEQEKKIEQEKIEQERIIIEQIKIEIERLEQKKIAQEKMIEEEKIKQERIIKQIEQDEIAIEKIEQKKIEQSKIIEQNEITIKKLEQKERELTRIVEQNKEEMKKKEQEKIIKQESTELEKIKKNYTTLTKPWLYTTLHYCAFSLGFLGLCLICYGKYLTMRTNT